MKRILFIILVISLIFAACSNSVNNNAIKPPKAGNSVLPNLVETTSPSTEINAPNEGNASSNELNEILNEADQALGGDDYTFDRFFIESTCNAAFTDLIVGR